MKASAGGIRPGASEMGTVSIAGAGLVGSSWGGEGHGQRLGCKYGFPAGGEESLY